MKCETETLALKEKRHLWIMVDSGESCWTGGPENFHNQE